MNDIGYCDECRELAILEIMEFDQLDMFLCKECLQDWDDGNW